MVDTHIPCVLSQQEPKTISALSIKQLYGFWGEGVRMAKIITGSDIFSVPYVQNTAWRVGGGGLLIKINLIKKKSAFSPLKQKNIVQNSTKFNHQTTAAQVDEVDNGCDESCRTMEMHWDWRKL